MGLLGVAFWTYGMNIWRDKSHNSFASPPGGKTRREQSETLNFGYRLNPRTVLDVLRQIPCAGSFWIKKFYQFSAAAYIISFLTMAWQMFLTNNESSSCVCEEKKRALHTMIVWLWLRHPYTGNGGRPQGDGLIWMKTDLNMYSCCECRVGGYFARCLGSYTRTDVRFRMISLPLVPFPPLLIACARIIQH